MPHIDATNAIKSRKICHRQFILLHNKIISVTKKYQNPGKNRYIKFLVRPKNISIKVSKDASQTSVYSINHLKKTNIKQSLNKYLNADKVTNI